MVEDRGQQPREQSARLGVEREAGNRQQNHFIENQFPTNPSERSCAPMPTRSRSSPAGPGRNEGVEGT